ncbi:hypothetical protein DFP72DRAFT_855697 [Ephemerocybe angulata]|uniref:Uncharacterized protein n=1 Tax=Ephemerocybe angulata TaxID=980116 RepID=A0A8H6HFI5_9AGAR|nr:hypothetical protein DFP72DRAFT_855697 [Tulosesus angulatus]
MYNAPTSFKRPQEWRDVEWRDAERKVVSGSPVVGRNAPIPFLQGFANLCPRANWGQESTGIYDSGSECHTTDLAINTIRYSLPNVSSESVLELLERLLKKSGTVFDIALGDVAFMSMQIGASHLRWREVHLVDWVCRCIRSATRVSRLRTQGSQGAGQSHEIPHESLQHARAKGQHLLLHPFPEPVTTVDDKRQKRRSAAETRVKWALKDLKSQLLTHVETDWEPVERKSLKSMRVQAMRDECLAESIRRRRMRLARQRKEEEEICTPRLLGS